MIEFVKQGEIWVRIVAGTRLRGKSVAMGDVLSVTREEYVNLAASGKAVKTDAPVVETPKPEPAKETTDNAKPDAPKPTAKPAKAAKTETKK